LEQYRAEYGFGRSDRNTVGCSLPSAAAINQLPSLFRQLCRLGLNGSLRARSRARRQEKIAIVEVVVSSRSHGYVQHDVKSGGIRFDFCRSRGCARSDVRVTISVLNLAASRGQSGDQQETSASRKKSPNAHVIQHPRPESPFDRPSRHCHQSAGRGRFHPCNRVIGTDRGIWSTSSPVVPRVAARSNVTLNVTLPGHTPFAGAVTRNSTVVTERVEGDAVQTELQVESEATVQQVCARSDPPRRIASHSRITAYLRAPMDGASRAGSLNGLDRTEHGRPLPSRPGGAPTIPRHIPGRP